MRQLSDREILSSMFASLKDETEKHIQKRIADSLAEYFTVQLEVASVDRSGRIDIVAVHHSDEESRYPIGIEVKTAKKKRGVIMGEWIQQASRYSTIEFKNYGSVSPFLFPQLSGLFLDEGTENGYHSLTGYWDEAGAHHNVSTMLSRFGLGELQLYTKSGQWWLRMVYAAKVIWRQHDNRFRPENLLHYSKAA